MKKPRMDKGSAARINIYIPIADKRVWDRALAMSSYPSISAMLRDLVAKLHKRQLKRAAKDCPE
jgi:hypothetical protein